jgi:O-antigen/teichoic acid export membrane protein
MNTARSTAAGAPSALVSRIARRFAVPHDLRKVLDGAAHVLAIRMTGAALTYFSMALLARWLGAFQFGIYAYVWVWIITLGIALPLGYNSTVLRYIPAYLARGQWRRAEGFLRQSFAVVLAASTLGAIAAAILVVALGDFIEPYYRLPLLIGMASVPVAALLGQMEGTARAFGTVHLAFTPNYIVRPVLIMLVVGGLFVLGHMPTAEDALYAVLIAFSVGAVGQALLMLRVRRRQLPAIRPVYDSRRWTAVSLSFLMIEGFRLLLDNADVMLIGKLLDPDSVAVYFAAIRTGGLIAFIYFAVAALAVPRISQIHGAGSREEMQRFVSGIIRLMFWPSVAAALLLALVGPLALSLFGAGFERGYLVLLIVLTGLVVRAATGPVEYLLNMTGHQMDTVRVYAAAAFANIAANFLLIPELGIVGAALATYGAIVAANVALCLCVWRRLGVKAIVFYAR